MNQPADDDCQRLAVCLSNDCSGEEREAAMQWAASDPQRHALLGQLRAAWGSVRGESLPPLDVGVLRRVVAQEIEARRIAGSGRAKSVLESPDRERLRRPSAVFRRPWTRLAGATIGIAASIVLIWQAGRQPTHAVESAVYRTARGQRAVVRFGDGSVMTLAPATTARVTGTVVSIDGEAQFVVQPNPDHPFTVRMGENVVNVLGTTFGVRHYVGERESRVVVQEGRVSLQVDGDSSEMPVILTSGMMAHANDSTITVTRNVLMHDYAAWTGGALVFDGVPLRNLVADLARAYDVDIHIGDSTLANQSMTMRVSVRRQSITQVLDFIGLANDIHYERKGNAFVLVRGRRPSDRQKPTVLPSLEKHYGR
jgi:transmembrane sensor